MPGSVLPANTTEGSYGFGGNRKKITETAFTLTPIQMGARVYLPGLGRFTSVDPVPGGAANAYVYAQDPINTSDYSGKFIIAGLLMLAKAISSSASVKAYTHYLIGGGKPRTISVNLYKWDTKAALKSYASTQKSGTRYYAVVPMKNMTPLKMVVSAIGAEGSEVIGGATMHFRGAITVDTKKRTYHAYGRASFSDIYDFNRTWWDGNDTNDRVWYKEYVTWGGAIGGWPFSKNYENIIQGSILIDETGSY